MYAVKLNPHRCPICSQGVRVKRADKARPISLYDGYDVCIGREVACRRGTGRAVQTPDCVDLNRMRDAESLG